MPNSTLPPYIVTLVDASSLTADQRAAAELRFRMALEFALGGPEMVLPTLQAWQLAVSLNDDLPLQSPHAAEREVIALWESAEADALIAALRPLDQDLGDARFEIKPRPQADLSWP